VKATIRTKLLAGFGVLLLLLSGIGVLGLVKLNEANHAVDAMIEYQLAAVEAGDSAISALPDRQGEETRAIGRGARAAIDEGARLVLGGIVAALLLGLGMGWWLSRSITRGLSQVTRAANGLAEGDLEQTIAVGSRDEIGQMADAFRRMIAYQKEMASVATAVAAGDLTRQVEPKSERDALGIAFRDMVTNLRALAGQVQQSAEGLAGTGEQLGAAACQTSGTVQQVTNAVQQVAQGAQEQSNSARGSHESVEQLLQAIDQVARGAQEQARAVAGASATTEQMAASVEQVAENAERVAAASQQTKVSADLGARAVRETVDGMAQIQTVVSGATGKVEDLGKLGERIGAVVETIDDIAEQTNLLALNAAIEAARAGEHGRGFAVVADEVRKLAERSRRETKAIGELIRDVQGGTRDAVQAMAEGAAHVQAGAAQAERAGRALDEILAAAEQTVEQVTVIASAAQQMAARSRDVTGAMASISAVVEEATAATEEMAATAVEVGRAIGGIAAVAEENSAAAEEVSASAEEMSAQVEEMSAQADELSATATQLRALVAQFHLQVGAASSPAHPDAWPADEAPARRAA
jgi:methyl-accepting chemotaxis protein